MDRHAVISSYNCHPGWIKNYFDSFCVYDQSSDSEISKTIEGDFPSLIRTENSGHSLSHYLMYIIANYGKLHDFEFFLKSNLVPRHTDTKSFEKSLELEGYISIFNDTDFKDKPFIAHHVIPGYFIEINNSWYVDDEYAEYFRSYDAFMNFFFNNYSSSSFLLFTPGGNFGVPRSAIQRYPKSFYEALLHLVTYKFFPPESYILERALFSIFSGKYNLAKQNFSKQDYITELNNLSEVKNHHNTKVILGRVRKKIKSKLLFEIYRRII